MGVRDGETVIASLDAEPWSRGTYYAAPAGLFACCLLEGKEYCNHLQFILIHISLAQVALGVGVAGLLSKEGV